MDTEAIAFPVVTEYSVIRFFRGTRLPLTDPFAYDRACAVLERWIVAPGHLRLTPPPSRRTTRSRDKRRPKTHRTQTPPGAQRSRRPIRAAGSPSSP